MKLQSSRITMLVLIGVLFLSVSSVYAETAEEYCNRGLVYTGRGNFTQAISDFTKAIEINPSHANSYEGLAQVYFDKKEYEKAWIYVHKAEALGYRVEKEDLEFLDKLKKASGKDK
jgi:Tfp pilus assembly protein PilF